MEQIKAILVREFGEPEVLELVDVERPSPGPGEAVIEVRAIGVNYADTMRRRNQYVEAQDLPFIPGSEVAGVVAEVGEGVEGVVAGDQVVTLLGTGGYAEYAVTRAGNLIPIPDSLDFDEAAATPSRASPLTTASRPPAPSKQARAFSSTPLPVAWVPWPSRWRSFSARAR